MQVCRSVGAHVEHEAVDGRVGLAVADARRLDDRVEELERHERVEERAGVGAAHEPVVGEHAEPQALLAQAAHRRQHRLVHLHAQRLGLQAACALALAHRDARSEGASSCVALRCSHHMHSESR